MSTQKVTKLPLFSLKCQPFGLNFTVLLKKLKKICTKKILFSVPVLNHWLTPQRKIRYKMRNCPLWFYDEIKINNLMSKVSIENFLIHKIDRDYLIEITL